MMLSLLLLAVLFIAALVNGFLYIPPKLLFGWVQSLVPCNKVSDVSTAATNLSPKEKKKNTNNKDELKRVFATFDKNGDGFITRQELGESLNCIGFTTSEREVAAMVERLDANGDGLIDLDEFCELYLSMGSGKDGEGGGSEEVGEEDLKEAFEVFDGNKDGFITVDELGMVLSSLGMKQGMRMQDCKEMISKVDMDGDGMVNFEEFKQMMRAGGKLVAVS